jgi:hypothetical protein
VVFQQWGKVKKCGVAEQWCFSNGESQKVWFSAMKKEQRVADSGVSAMGKLVSS